MVARRVGGNLSGTQCREHWKRISPERKPAGLLGCGTENGMRNVGRASSINVQ